jgi:hypothetical protein
MNFKSCHLPANRGRGPDHDCEEVMDKVYSSRLNLMDTPSQIQSSSSSQIEVGLSREDGERQGSQLPLLMTTYMLKPYHKDGPHMS